MASKTETVFDKNFNYLSNSFTVALNQLCFNCSAKQPDARPYDLTPTKMSLLHLFDTRSVTPLIVGKIDLSKIYATSILAGSDVRRETSYILRFRDVNSIKSPHSSVG